ncbi:MAG: hypothetical protein SF002_06990, partial [Alphaproteobacteria bacterium]|nr:hypothetical protein [Alphaproteobacteria bacterium]
MATYTFSSSTGEIFTPVAGVPDTIDIPNVSDIHATDTVVGTGSEAPNQDQLRLLQNSPGTLSLDSAAYPNIFGVESFGLVGSHSAAFTFNLDYSWLSNNRDNTDYFTASFLNGTGGYTINITGTPVAGRFRVELGQGNDTLTGGTGDDWAVVSGTGSTLINLGAGLDNLIIAGLTSVSLSDTIEGGAGTDTLTFEAMVGTTAAINYTNVTGFEHLVFATQTGALDITLPQNVVSGPATMEIQGGTGSRAISFSTWSTSINVTTISATAPVSL